MEKCITDSSKNITWLKSLCQNEHVENCQKGKIGNSKAGSLGQLGQFIQNLAVYNKNLIRYCYDTILMFSYSSLHQKFYSNFSIIPQFPFLDLADLDWFSLITL